jgi:TMEM175 potassium channel family protein
MNKGRLEAFSDGVIAIIITIMVLELKRPDGTSWSDLVPLLPVLASYVLAFVAVAIYWTNHHHIFQAATHVNGAVLWANTHLLFWLSLMPFFTGWMGETGLATVPVMLFGLDLVLSGIAFNILVRALVSINGNSSVLATTLGASWKGLISTLIYSVAILVALANTWVAFGLYLLVAAMWLVPDRRIERALGDQQ